MTGISEIPIMVMSIAIMLATGSSANDGDWTCGQVQNLNVKETDTELIVTWDPPIDDGEIRLCGRFYYIDYTIDGVIQPPVELHTPNIFTITKDSCVDHWIAISSSQTTGAPAAQLSIEYYSGIVGTGAVQDLRVEGLSAVWTQPENSQNCRLTYQVDITNELEETSEITDALSFLLPNEYCLTNNATVSAIVLGNDRNGQPMSLIHTMPEGTDAPVHQFTNPTWDGAQVGWRRSDTPNYCQISEIEFTIADSTPIPRVPVNPNEDLVTATFTNLPTDIDFWYTAKWILASGVEGITSDPIRFRIAGCGEVQNLHVEESDTELIVTWDPPIDDGDIRLCGRFYYIDYKIDDVIQPPVELHPTNTFTITKGSCVDHWIAIRSSHTTGAPAAQLSIEHHSGIVGTGAVQDLRVEGLSAVWTQPENSQNCKLTYQVNITNELGETSDITDALTFPLPNKHCLTNIVTVSTILSGNDRTDQSMSLNHTMPEGSDAPVHQYTNPTTHGAHVGWRRSDAPNYCEISEIEFTIAESTPIPRVPFNPDEDLVSATFTDLPSDTEFWYTAKWILKGGGEGITSDPVRFHTAGCGQVQNLAVEETDTELIVTWDPPIDDGEIRLCGRFYYIDYMIDDVIQPHVDFYTANEFTITKGSCVDHWIAIRSSYATGAPAALLDIEHYSGIVGTGAVKDLRVEGLSAVWTQPENSQNCELTYRVDISNQLEETTDTTDALTFRLPNGYCLTNNATVSAIVLGNDRNGEPTSLIHTMPEGSDAPVHEFTNPRTHGVEVGWRRSDAPNYCQISEIEFTIADSTPIPRVPFNPDEDLVEATFTDLQPNTDFSYTARWILESGVEGTTSDPVIFNTGTCGQVQNLNVEETDTELIVTWDPPVDDGEIPLCGTVYYIDYMIDDVSQDPVDYHTANYFTITKGSCVNHLISIRSSYYTGAPAAQLSIEYYSGIVGTGAVRDLSVEGLSAVWTQPENSQNCKLTYQVNITNELGVTSDIIDALTFPLPNEYCLMNEVTVSAIVLGNDRNGQPMSLVYTMPEGSDAPVHQFTNPTTEGAQVGWKRSDAPNYCRISEIEFTIADSTPIPRVPVNPDANLVTATFTDLPSDVDFWYTAKWILESGFEGITSDPIRFTTAACGQVQNLAVEETDTELIVTWDPPMDDGEIRLCGRFYYIDYMIDDVIQPHVDFYTLNEFTITKGSCVNHWIAIRSSYATGAPAALLDIEHYSGIVGTGAVQDLRFEGLSAVWTQPENSQNCDLTYRVDISNQLEETTDTTDALTFRLPNGYCLTNNATVSAIVLGNKRNGQPMSLIHTMPEGSDAPVHQFTNPRTNGVQVGWRRSDEPNYCQISEIEFIIADSNAVPRVPFNPDEDLVKTVFTDLQSDTDFWYTAKWILESGVEGTTSDPIRFRTATCGQVQNLHVEETDTELIVTWDPPIDDGEIRLCGGFYYIDYIIGDVIQPPVTFHTATAYTITKGSCVDHSISIRSSDYNGAAAAQLSIEYFSGIVGTGAVQDLRVEELSAVWNQPQNSQNCRLIYRLNIRNELREYVGATNGRSFPFPDGYCLTNNVSVSAHVSGNDRNGQPMSLIHTMPEGSDAPVYNFTNPTTDGAEVGWQRSDVPNYCQISEIIFTIVDTYTPILRVPINPDEDMVIATFTDLQSDVEYWYTANWILESGVEGITSDPVMFKTL